MRATRRQVLELGSLAAASLVSPHILARALRVGSARAAVPADPILVIVQLEGGNDGLNTVVPLDGALRGHYDSLRPNIGIPVAEMAGAGSAQTELGADPSGQSLAFHPVMTALHGLYAQGRVAVVNGVGYPGQNLSHFRSEEIWFTADPVGGQPAGWFGAYLDASTDPDDVTAVSIDRAMTPVFDTTIASAIGFDRLSRFQLPDDPLFPDLAAKQTAWGTIYPSAAGIPGPGGDPLRSVGRVGVNVTGIADKLEDVQNTPFTSNLDAVSGSFRLKRGLRDVAAILNHDVTGAPADDTGLRFFHVRIGGFDTHSRQAEDPADRTGNRHGRLLHRTSETLAAFYGDLLAITDGLGIPVADRTLIMTFSEFGRRSFENASGADSGTDHGAAAPLFLIGSGVGGGIYGVAPGLSPAELDPVGNQPFLTDFRQVYATVLERWLGQDPSTVIPNAAPGQWTAIPGILP